VNEENKLSYRKPSPRHQTCSIGRSTLTENWKNQKGEISIAQNFHHSLCMTFPVAMAGEWKNSQEYGNTFFMSSISYQQKSKVNE
jgi:hypothetical protein